MRGWGGWCGRSPERGGLLAFDPGSTCQPIKYPRRKPERKAKLAEVIKFPVMRLIPLQSGGSHFSEAPRVWGSKQVKPIHRRYTIQTPDS
jgi:hypothetical protein